MIQEQNYSLNRGFTYFATLALSGVGFLVGNIFPLINGGFAETKGLTMAQLGFVSSIFVFSGAVAVSTAPLWIRKVNWRITTFLGVVTIALALVAITVVEGLRNLALVTCVMGIGSGLTQATTMTGLGDRPSPERAYGLSLAIQMAIQSVVVLLATHYLLPRFGFGGFLISIAAFAATVSLLAVALPSNQVSMKGRSEATQTALTWDRSLLPPAFGLFAIATFMAGILAVWFFMERIGHDAGLSNEQIGLALAVSGVATVAASGLVGVAGGGVTDLTGTFAGIVIAMAGLFALGTGSSQFYTVGVCAISCGWGIAQPYLWGMTARVDRSKLLYAASPAALGFGGSIGISIGGVIAESSGFGVLAISTAAIFGLTLASAWAAVKLSIQRDYLSGSR